MKKITSQQNRCHRRMVSDPSDYAGSRIRGYQLYQTYFVEHIKAIDICEQLYQYVFDKVRQGSLGDSKASLFLFRDREFPRCERRYIVLSKDTIRDNRITIFARFFDYGDNLYLGIDTYILGAININLLAWRLFVSILAPFVTAMLLSRIATFFNSNVSPYGTQLVAVEPHLLGACFIILLLFLWRRFLRLVFLEGVNAEFALRQEFPSKVAFDSFDLDDVLMFVKSTLHIMILSIKIIFEKESLPLESLDNFMQNINNSVRINTESGSIIFSNSVLGIGNKLKILEGGL